MIASVDLELESSEEAGLYTFVWHRTFRDPAYNHVPLTVSRANWTGRKVGEFGQVASFRLLSPATMSVDGKGCCIGATVRLRARSLTVRNPVLSTRCPIFTEDTYRD